MRTIDNITNGIYFSVWSSAQDCMYSSVWRDAYDNIWDQVWWQVAPKREQIKEELKEKLPP